MSSDVVCKKRVFLHGAKILSSSGKVPRKAAPHNLESVALLSCCFGTAARMGQKSYDYNIPIVPTVACSLYSCLACLFVASSHSQTTY